MSVLWEYTVTKALGRCPESGRIYNKAFDKAKIPGEERSETLVVSVGLGDCSWSENVKHRLKGQQKQTRAVGTEKQQGLGTAWKAQTPHKAA